MGKVKGILQGTRGRVGGLVFSKGSDGGTVVKEYTGTTRNPKTPQQVAQRIIFSTVAQAAKLMKPIINHSFEGVGYGNQSIRKFRKENLRRLRNLAAIDFADNNKGSNANVFMTTRNIQALIPNQYVISDGSLAQGNISVVYQHDGTDNTSGLKLKFQRRIFPAPTQNTETTTYLTLGDVIMSMFGISSTAEQLTLVQIVKSATGYKYAYNNDDSVAGQIVLSTAVKASRVVLKPSADLDQIIQITEGVDLNNLLRPLVMDAVDAEKSDMSFVKNVVFHVIQSGNILIEAASLDETTIEIDEPAVINDLNGLNTPFATEQNSVGACLAAGVIRSKLDNGNWMRSPCSLVTAKPLGAVAGTPSKINFGLDWTVAPLAWDETLVVAEDDRYLNEGGTTGTIGE